MQFQYLKDLITDEVCPDRIRYTDDAGEVWTVPRGHRFWEGYEAWLSQGNTPQPVA